MSAGKVAAVGAAGELCKAAGAKRALPLPVSAPFHTALMRPAGVKLEAALAALQVSATDIPVVHNVHAQPETDPARIRELLVEQIYSPVQWTACVAAIAAGGITRLVECGPGKVLSGLNRRIDKSLESFTIEQPEDMTATLAQLQEN